VLFLSGMVAMIMLRTLHKDIARYNQMDDSVRTTLCQFLHGTLNKVLWAVHMCLFQISRGTFLSKESKIGWYLTKTLQK